MHWLLPILVAFGISTAALIGSAAVLAFRDRAEHAAVWMLSFAVGTLLGAAMLGLLPEALEHAPVERVMPLVLAGIVGFILVERALRFRHPHEPHGPGAAPAHVEVTAALLLWGDALHNVIDGLVLGVSFGVDAEVGMTAAIAIFAHEVPQEIGDFAVLLSSGMQTRRALLLNYLSAVTVVPGAIVAFAWSSASHQMIGWLLPLAAGGFLYIALADLVPALHHRRGRSAGMAQTVLLLAGILVMALLSRLGHG